MSREKRRVLLRRDSTCTIISPDGAEYVSDGRSPSAEDATNDEPWKGRNILYKKSNAWVLPPGNIIAFPNWSLGMRREKRRVLLRRDSVNTISRREPSFLFLFRDQFCSKLAGKYYQRDASAGMRRAAGKVKSFVVAWFVCLPEKCGLALVWWYALDPALPASPLLFTTTRRP